MKYWQSSRQCDALAHHLEAVLSGQPVGSTKNAHALPIYELDSNSTNDMAGSAKLTRDLTGLGGLDDPWKRLPIVAITALAAWLLLLTICGLLLGRMVPTAPGNSAVDAQLITLSGAAPVSKGAAALESRYEPSAVARSSAAAIAPPLPTPHGQTETAANYSATAASHARAATRRALSNNRWHEAHCKELTSARIEPDRDTIATKPSALQNRMAPKMPESSSNQPAEAARISAPSATDSNTMGLKSGASGSGSSHGQASGSNGAYTGEGSGPRPIYAPVPAIPDDMRDEVLEATAVVRFHVERDGRAKVALITPTEYLTLDQLILDALRNWRFQPAMRNGVAVESDAEVRLRITVQ